MPPVPIDSGSPLRIWWLPVNCQPPRIVLAMPLQVE